MNRPLEACLVDEDSTIRDAMAALDRGGRQIVLVVDADQRLVGVVTDGDLRRAILAGAAIGDPLAPHVVRSPIAVGPAEGRAEVLDLMRARRIAAIPVVDPDGRPTGLHRLNEFLEPLERPNWAVVMAGGTGTRLRPLTEDVPKPMLRVAGRPILERIILHLVGHGINRIFIAVNYLGGVIEAHFEDGAGFGCRIEYLREERPLGTGGALGLLPDAPTEPLLVMNGDLVTTADLGGLLDFHSRGGYTATIGLRRYVHQVPFGVADRAGDRIERLAEKPAIVREVNTGIYAVEPALVARVDPGTSVTMPELIGAALDRGEAVGAFEIEDDWIDVGQREQLDRARGGGDA
jgi:dTDP-glucose pyrophosphorylase